jgi:aspartate aminotransferase
MRAECLPFLEPQERFDEIAAGARRQNPRLVDLAYANASDGPDQRVLGALRQALADDRELSFQYTPYGGKTPIRRLIATSLGRRFHLDATFRDIVLTPGAMAALNAVFATLFGDGQEVLVLTPGWLDYPLYLTNLGIPFRFVPLREDKHLDVDAIEAALTPRTAGIVFPHPGCPTGVLFGNDELAALARVVGAAEQRFRGRIFVISDEVHRDVVWSGAPFVSALCHHPRTLAVYSFGKSLFLQGQRIGYIALSPRMPEREELQAELVRAMRTMGFCTPTALMQRAIAQLVDYTPALGTIAERQELTRAALREYGYRLCDAQATFFVYAQCPVPDDFTFVERLAQRGVLVLPSSMFHERGWFRISLTARTEALRKALPVFQSVRRA